jgi:hypothetical protein
MQKSASSGRKREIMAKVRAGFVYSTRVFEAEFDDTDVSEADVPADVWARMSLQQKARYLSAQADLASVLYAHEEHIAIIGDVKTRVKELREKAAKACQVS